MPRIGLTTEIVVASAIKIIEETGGCYFSMHEFASKLGIKAASLYNHVASFDDLLTKVGVYSADILSETLNNSIAGLTGEDAINALFASYRDFAVGHKGLYKVMMGMQPNKSGHTNYVDKKIIGPISSVLASYNLDKTDRINFQRMIRVTLHGLVSFEYEGRFTHSSVTFDETVKFVCNCVSESVKRHCAE